ncbi:ATP-binding cassette domain-containing protein [Falsirhodobacter sp. 1013]|uniref:ATP-binding cassette domain-containing protein n=1 Tax=Falsirhodobacter sp. 1013 TaxID=3417566 RepID=UPI003EB779AE
MSSRPSTLSFRNFGVALQGRVLLKDLTFRIGAGERAALLGQSGSSKSLSARAVLGLMPWPLTLSGTVEVNGTDSARTHALNRWPKTRAAMIMPDTQSAPNPLTTVGHQIGRPLMRHRGLSRAAAREEAVRLMMRMGLPGMEILDRCSPELSAGSGSGCASRWFSPRTNRPSRWMS